MVVAFVYPCERWKLGKPFSCQEKNHLRHPRVGKCAGALAHRNSL